ncbi:MAG TPA: hypothetical protein VF668_00345 [Pyrinomonadaceae bacterium]|jgi:hypothetical protein
MGLSEWNLPAGTRLANASFQVCAEGESRARPDWVTYVLPEEVAAPIRRLVEQGAAVMKRALDGRRATT